MLAAYAPTLERLPRRARWAIHGLRGLARFAVLVTCPAEFAASSIAAALLMTSALAAAILAGG